MATGRIKTHYPPGAYYRALCSDIGTQLVQTRSFVTAISYGFSGTSLTAQTGSFGITTVENFSSSTGFIGKFSSSAINSSTGSVKNLTVNNYTSKNIVIGIYVPTGYTGNIGSVTINSITGDSANFNTITVSNMNTTLNVPNTTGSSAFFNTITGINAYASQLTSGSGSFDYTSANSGFINVLVTNSYEFPASGTIDNLTIVDTITGSNVYIQQQMSGSILYCSSISGSSSYFNSFTGIDVSVINLFGTNCSGSSAFFSSITGINIYTPEITASTGTFGYLDVGTGFINSIVSGTFIPLDISVQNLSITNTLTGTNIYSSTMTGGTIKCASITAPSAFFSSITGNNLYVQGSQFSASSFTGMSAFFSAVTGINTFSTTITTTTGVFDYFNVGTGTFTNLSVYNAIIYPQSILNATISNTLTGSNFYLVNMTGGTIYCNSITGSSGFFTTITGSIGTTSKFSVSSITGDSAFFSSITGTVIYASQSLSSSSGTFDYILAGTGHISTLTSHTFPSSSAENLSIIDTITGSNVYASNIIGRKIYCNSMSGSSGFFNSLTGVNVSITNIFGPSSYTGSYAFFTTITGANNIYTLNTTAPTGIFEYINSGTGYINSLVFPLNSEPAEMGGQYFRGSYRMGFSVSDDLLKIGTFVTENTWNTTHYITVDGGVSWYPVKGTYNLTQYDLDAVCVSKDGSYWLGTHYAEFSPEGGIYRSTDGINFSLVQSIPITTIIGLIPVCAISPNGQVAIVPTASNGATHPVPATPFYISTDRGMTWNSVTPINVHPDIYDSVLSNDGKYMLVVDAAGIFVSSDYGINWSFTSSNPNTEGRKTCMSLDGMYMYIIDCGINDPRLPSLHISTNYGTDWTTIRPDPTGKTDFYGICCDITGKNVFLVSYRYFEDFISWISISSNCLWISSNYGSTFFRIPIPGFTSSNNACDCQINTEGRLQIYDNSDPSSSVTTGFIWTGNLSGSFTFISNDVSVRNLNVTNTITGTTFYTNTMTGGTITCNSITGSSAFFSSITGNVYATSNFIIDSITGSYGFFTTLTGSTSIYADTAISSMITGSSAYASSLISSLTGTNIYAITQINATEITGSTIFASNSISSSSLNVDTVTPYTAGGSVSVAGVQLFNSVLNLKRTYTTQALATRAVTNWTSTTPVAFSLSRICYSSELGLFCMVSGASLGYIWTSSNGTSWTTQYGPFAAGNFMNDICWSPEKNLFVGVGEPYNPPTKFAMITSSNGTSWTTISLPISVGDGINSICYSPELGLFTCNGSKNLYSTDGTNWTSFSSTASITGICWSSGLGLFVGVGSSSTVQWSTTGTSWTNGTGIAANTTMVNVCWSSDLNIFCAIGLCTSPYGGVIYTSSDGKTWLSRTLPNSGTLDIVYSMGWSPDLGCFAVQAINTAIYSFDGINWTTSVMSIYSGPARGICWARELGIFVEVGDGGEVNYSKYVKQCFTTPINYSPIYPYSITYLAVAGGGGGGGGGGSNRGGGGGGGGVLSSTFSASFNTTYTITIGIGGTGGIGPATASTNGGDSTISPGGITAVGGGGGGGYGAATGQNGGNGGGGSYYGGSSYAGGSGSQGNSGGSGNGSGSNTSGGGGGGMASNGADGSSGNGGNGADGYTSLITGSSVTYGGGGGGGGLYPGGSYGAGGSGGGGHGGTSNASPIAGTINTGGGGGGSGIGERGGGGGSGVVILSLLTKNYSGVITGSPTVTTSGKNTILKYINSGTYVG